VKPCATFVKVDASSLVFFSSKYPRPSRPDLPQAAVRFAADHALAVEIIALEADRVDHHFFARARSTTVPTRSGCGVVAVGEDEDDAPPLDALQLVEARADCIP